MTSATGPSPTDAGKTSRSERESNPTRGAQGGGTTITIIIVIIISERAERQDVSRTAARIQAAETERGGKRTELDQRDHHVLCDWMKQEANSPGHRSARVHATSPRPGTSVTGMFCFCLQRSLLKLQPLEVEGGPSLGPSPEESPSSPGSKGQKSLCSPVEPREKEAKNRVLSHRVPAVSSAPGTPPVCLSFWYSTAVVQEYSSTL